MSYMWEIDQALRLASASVVLLVAAGSCIAWLPAIRYEPAGLPSRIFMAAGLIMAIADFGGVGAVLGLSLAALGGFVAWEGQPAAEVPRPHRRGLVIAAVVTGVATLATIEGWAVLERLPDGLRAVATVVVATTGALATLAMADRSRVALRDALRRRFELAPPPRLL